jgi:hypothetical protein
LEALFLSSGWVLGPKNLENYNFSLQKCDILRKSQFFAIR